MYLNVSEIRQLGHAAHEDVLRAHLKTELQSAVNKVCEKPLYVVYDNQNEKLEIPFLRDFHTFFLKRKWDQSASAISNIGEQENLYRLKKHEKGGNYSQNEGNYNHFINVVSSIARLINYFSNNENAKKVLSNHLSENESNKLAKIISYDEKDTLRIFTLMLAAFYHDLGKTVINRRHGMEGFIILSNHKSKSWYQLKQIGGKYIDEKYRYFEREDLLFVSELVLNHDVFGTLSTGESAYQKLINFIVNVKHYSADYKKTESTSNFCFKKIKEWSSRYLFDLWILNVADIMTSIKHESLESKWESQKIWKEKTKSDDFISNLLTKENKRHTLVHDLIISNNLLENHIATNHSADLSSLEETSLKHSRDHVIDRIGRLIAESILSNKPHSEQSSENDKSEGLISEIILYCKREDKLRHIIYRAIRLMGNYQTFCNRAALIGHMDYALSFFGEIASTALNKVNKELDEKGKSTNWIRDKNATNFTENKVDNSNYLNKANARFFLENYTMTVVQIINYILFREESFDSFRNLEFSDAQERLTDAKIEAIMGMSGPYWSRGSVYSSLETIFFW